MEPLSVAERLFYVPHRIETVQANGDQVVGTSFLFQFKKEGKLHPFLLTNKHVVEGAVTGEVSFMKAQRNRPQLGEGITKRFSDFEKHWHGHPKPDVDVAVLPLTQVIQDFEEMRDGVRSRQPTLMQFAVNL